MLYMSFQVLDYGLLIRLDDGRLLVRQLVKVLQVLLALRGSRKSAYVDGIIMQLLVLLYQHNKSLPMWTMLVNNANVYNEEAGEQAFSVLSRCVLGDTQKSKFDHLNRMYTLLHRYMAADEDCREGYMENRVTWRKSYDLDSPEVTGTKAFLEHLLRRISHNSTTIYDGTKSSFKSAASAAAHLQPRPNQKAFFDVTLLDADFTLCFKKAQTKYMSQLFCVAGVQSRS